MSIYINSCKKYLCQKYYYDTQIKDFDPDFDHFIDMLARTTTIKQEKPLESISQRIQILLPQTPSYHSRQPYGFG